MTIPWIIVIDQFNSNSASIRFFNFLFFLAMRMDRWATQASTHRTPASIERSYESSGTKQLQDETPPKAIPLPKPALLTQSWIFEHRRFYPGYFTNHRTQDKTENLSKQQNRTQISLCIYTGDSRGTFRQVC